MPDPTDLGTLSTIPTDRLLALRDGFDAEARISGLDPDLARVIAAIDAETARRVQADGFNERVDALRTRTCRPGRRAMPDRPSDPRCLAYP